MKTAVILLLFGFTLFALSCNKVDYSSYGETCELCEFASEAEGTYRGVMTWDSVLTYIPDVMTISDSVTVQVEQLFLNNNAYDDSTVMYFKTTWDRDQMGIVLVDTIQIHNNDGKVEFYTNYQISNHSWVTRYSWIKDGVYRKFSRYYYNFTILHMDATLYKL